MQIFFLQIFKTFLNFFWIFLKLTFSLIIPHNPCKFAIFAFLEHFFIFVLCVHFFSKNVLFCPFSHIFFACFFQGFWGLASTPPPKISKVHTQFESFGCSKAQCQFCQLGSVGNHWWWIINPTQPLPTWLSSRGFPTAAGPPSPLGVLQQLFASTSVLSLVPSVGSRNVFRGSSSGGRIGRRPPGVPWSQRNPAWVHTPASRSTAFASSTLYCVAQLVHFFVFAFTCKVCR